MRIIRPLIVLSLTLTPIVFWAQEEKKAEIPTNREQLKEATEDMAVESAKTFRDQATATAKAVQEQCIWLVRDVQNDIREMRRDWNKHLEKHW